MKRLILLILFVTLAFTACDGKPSVESSAEADVENPIPEGMKEYSSDKYQIKLYYPKEWTLNESYGERYEFKNDGYFTIIAINGGDEATALEIATAEAEHELAPYGSEPNYKKMSIDGQESILITPSHDQAKDMTNQSAVIIKYPEPIIIKDGEYYFIEIVSDIKHIKEITETVKFIKK